MKKIALVSLVAMTLTGCGGMANDLYRMAQTSHDAGSCTAFRGQTKKAVEESLQLKPIDSFEDGSACVEHYEKGNFGAAILYNDGKVSKFFCGNRSIATGVYRKHADALIEGSVGAKNGSGLIEKQVLMPPNLQL